MKTDLKIFALGIMLGLLFWMADSVVDHRIFYPEKTLWEISVTDLPAIELYIRITSLAIFASFGLFIGRLYTRLRNRSSAQRLSEERLTRILTGMRDGLWEWPDLSTRECWWSTRHFEMFGHRDQEFTPTIDRFLAMVHEEHRAEMRAAVERTLSDCQPFDNECRMRTKLGEYRWFRIQGNVICDGTGRPLRVTGSTRDITDRKQVEEALRESEAFLNETGDMARVGGWEINLENEAVTWTQTTRVIHETPDDYLPTVSESLMFYDSEFRPILAEAIRQARREGKPFDLVLRLATAKGNRHWVHMVGRPEFHDGKCQRLWGVIQDITAQRQAETTREVLRRIVRALSGPVDIKTAGQIVAEESKRLFNHDALTFAILDEKREFLLPIRFEDTPVGHSSPCEVPPGDQDFPVGQSTLADGIAKLINRDPEVKETKFRPFGDTTRISKSLMIAPLRWEGQAIGVFSVQSYTPGRYGEEDFALFKDLADQLSVVMARLRLEKAALQSRAEWETIFQAIGHPVVILDPEHGLIEANDAVFAATGLSIDDLRGKKCWEIFHSPEATGPPEGCPMVAMLSNTHAKISEMEVEAFGGTYLVSCAPVYDANGKLLRAIHIATDISDRQRADQALRESEERLRTLINAMPDIVCFKDGEGRWLVVNDFELRLFQLEGVDYRGKTDAELASLSPVYREISFGCEESDERAWRTGAPTRTDEVIPRLDGPPAIFDIIKVPTFHPDGRRKGLVVVGRDVTRRHLTEEILEQRNSSLALLNRVAEVTMGTPDPQRLAEEILGVIRPLMPCDAFILDSFDEETNLTRAIACYDTVGDELHLVEPVDVQVRPDGPLFHTVVQRHQPLRIHRQDIVQESTPYVPFGDSARPSASIVWAPLISGGHLVGLVSVQSYTPNAYSDQDIETLEGVAKMVGPALEAALLTKQLRVSEQRFRRILETVPDAMFLADLDTGELIEANASAAALMGRPIEQLIGMNQTQLHPPGEDERYRDLFKSHRNQGGNIIAEECEIQRADGERVPVEISSRILEIEGRNAVLGVFRDLTERRRLESELRQSQKMEAIGQLAGGVAHDFNNLLLAIQGNASLVRDELDEFNPHREDLDQVIQATERAAALTRQLLAFSRQQMLRPVDLDLNHLIGNLMKMLRRLIPENIQLHVEMGSDLRTVCADPGQIEQVILNLCVNARDAMPHGGDITIATRNVTLEPGNPRLGEGMVGRDFVLLSVADNGHGMGEEEMNHIFEPFFTTKEVGKGTGLGLATVFGIVKQHDGLIDVESSPGKGARFDVLLPLSLVELDEPVLIQDEPETVSTGTETILLAEDDPMVRGMVIRILERAGYRVHATFDGAQAVEVFRANAESIDLVLLDMIMPSMGGRDALERIREIRPDVRALFVTGYDPDAAHSEVAEAMGIRVVTKPFHPRDLLLRIRATLNA